MAVDRDLIDEARRNWRAQGWSSAELGMGVVTSIVRANQLLTGRIDAVLRPHGLTFARYEVLMLLRLSRHGAMRVGTIGERLQVHPTTAVSAVDKLVAQGFVVRRPHPTDGRAVLVELTDAGQEVLEAATPELNDVFGELGLNAADLSTLYGLLRKLRAAEEDRINP